MAFDISSYQEGYTDGYEDARKHYDRTAEVLSLQETIRKLLKTIEESNRSKGGKEE